MLYNYNISYVINLININKLKKKLTFNIFFTKKNLYFVNFLKNFNLIHRYSLVKLKNKTYIKIYLYYYRNKIICNNFKIISRPAKSFFLSYKALRLVSKKTGFSVFIVSNSKGIVSHHCALKDKNGGMLLGFFSF